MAVITQYPYINENGEDDVNFVKFYSDEGKMLIKLETGEEYEEAIDTYPSRFTYVEKEEIPITEDEYGRTENTH